MSYYTVHNSRNITVLVIPINVMQNITKYCKIETSYFVHKLINNYFLFFSDNSLNHILYYLNILFD